jgi:hypothetical protein
MSREKSSLKARHVLNIAESDWAVDAGDDHLSLTLY